MKKNIIIRQITSILYLSFILSCGDNSQFTLLNGTEKSFDDYRGDWLVVNFWAQWCSPCLEEIPALNQIAKQSQLNVRVLGVSFDPLSNQELKRLVKKWDFQYPVLASSPVPILPFGLPKSLPTNYIFNPKGELVAKLTGKQSYQSLINRIKDLNAL